MLMMVMRARGHAPEASTALGDLCEAYWTPVYRFLKREGRSDDESRELTQEFFLRLLAGSTLEQANPAKGRFRSYLLGALKHFLSDHRRAEGRQKRGGDAIIESIGQLRDGQGVQPGGGQLNGQGNAVQPPDDLGNGASIGLA